MAIKKKSGKQKSKRPSSKRIPVPKRTSASQKPLSHKRTASSPKSSFSGSTKNIRRPQRTQVPNVTAQALDALTERLDIILPEVMMRIAAVEHLLVEKGYCSHEQLVGARQFIQEQEAS